MNAASDDSLSRISTISETTTAPDHFPTSSSLSTSSTQSPPVSPSIHRASTIDLQMSQELSAHLSLLKSFLNWIQTISSSKQHLPSHHPTRHVHKQQPLTFLRAELRYIKFLFLLNQFQSNSQEEITQGLASGKFLPPMDVLFFWYLHLLNLPNYIEDVLRLFDEELLRFTFPLTHASKFASNSVDPAILQSSAVLWETFTGEPYDIASVDPNSSFVLACPRCHHCIELAPDNFLQFKNHHYAPTCHACELVFTLHALSAKRFLNDLLNHPNLMTSSSSSSASFPTPPSALYLAGTLLRPSTFKPSPHIAKQLALYIAQTPGFEQLYQCFFSDDSLMRHPWSCIQTIFGLLQSTIHALDFGGITYEIRTLLSRIRTSYEDIMTPLSIDLTAQALPYFAQVAKFILKSFTGKGTVPSGYIVHDTLASSVGEKTTHKKLNQAWRRYSQFLSLQQMAIDRTIPLAPALDMHLCYWTHLLQSWSYLSHSNQLFHKLILFDIKDRLRLHEALSQTRVLWSSKFSTPFLPGYMPKLTLKEKCVLKSRKIVKRILALPKT